jgi:hypothetical protein
VAVTPRSQGRGVSTRSLCILQDIFHCAPPSGARSPMAVTARFACLLMFGYKVLYTSGWLTGGAHLPSVACSPPRYSNFYHHHTYTKCSHTGRRLGLACTLVGGARSPTRTLTDWSIAGRLCFWRGAPSEWCMLPTQVL